MGFIRNVIAGSFGVTAASISNSVRADASSTRDIKVKAIDMGHKIHHLPGWLKEMERAVRKKLSEEVRKDEEGAIRVVDEIIRDDLQIVHNTVNVGAYVIKILRDLFKEDVLITQMGFSKAVAMDLEKKITLELVKLAKGTEDAANVLSSLSDQARKAA